MAHDVMFAFQGILLLPIEAAFLREAELLARARAFVSDCRALVAGARGDEVAGAFVRVIPKALSLCASRQSMSQVIKAYGNATQEIRNGRELGFDEAPAETQARFADLARKSHDADKWQQAWRDRVVAEAVEALASLRKLTGRRQVVLAHDRGSLAGITVFLSRAAEDSELAEEIRRELEAFGVTVWTDDRILGGDQIPREIEKAISDSSHFVVLLTESSVEKPWIRAEIDATLMHYQDKGRPAIVPLKVGEVDAPLLLAGKKSIEFGDFESGMTKLWAAMGVPVASQITLTEIHRLLRHGEVVMEVVRDCGYLDNFMPIEPDTFEKLEMVEEYLERFGWPQETPDTRFIRTHVVYEGDGATPVFDEAFYTNERCSYGAAVVLEKIHALAVRWVRSVDKGAQ